jgi:hypothetical protein
MALTPMPPACPHCHRVKTSWVWSLANVVRLAIISCVYVILLVIELWDDPPSPSYRWKCPSCGLLFNAPARDVSGIPAGKESDRRCQCGYDLTGNVSGRCPECGKPVRNEDQQEKVQETSQRDLC